MSVTFSKICFDSMSNLIPKTITKLVYCRRFTFHQAQSFAMFWFCSVLAENRHLNHYYFLLNLVYIKFVILCIIFPNISLILQHVILSWSSYVRLLVFWKQDKARGGLNLVNKDKYVLFKSSLVLKIIGSC